MAFQRVPESAEAVVRWDFVDQIFTNTFYARLVGGYSLGDLQVLADAVDVVIGTVWRPILSNAVTYLEVAVRGLDSENDLVASANANAGVGGQASDMLPPNCAYAVKRLSGLTGRSARGRVYVTGLPRNGNDPANEANLTVGYAGSLVDAVDDVRTAIITTGWVPVIVSRRTGGLPRLEGVTFVWATTAATDTRIDSRRDRLP